MDVGQTLNAAVVAAEHHLEAMSDGVIIIFLFVSFYCEHLFYGKLYDIFFLWKGTFH